MSTIAAAALSDPEVQKNLIALGLGVLDSAPAVIFATAAVAAVQWQLEHTALNRNPEGKFWIKRLTTHETSNLKDKNNTPLSPPIVSLAIRLADAGADTAEAALGLATAQIQAQKSGGLVRSIQQFLFGG